MRFFCDAMLGKLARRLRIFGYDCGLAPNGAPDSEVVRLAEGRILLTRDRELAKLPNSLYVPGTTIRSQLSLLYEKYGIRLTVEPSRCPLCNGKLVEAKTANGPGWKCTTCGHEYWKGSHWDDIAKMAEEIERQSH